MAETDVVPGFISLPSRSMGGRASLSVSHIVAVGPTFEQQGRQQQCTISLEGGVEIVAFLRRADVLLLIAESIGAVPVGTGEQLNAVRDKIADNTRRLRLVVAAAQESTAMVAVLQAREAERVTRLDENIRANTRRLQVLGVTAEG